MFCVISDATAVSQFPGTASHCMEWTVHCRIQLGLANNRTDLDTLADVKTQWQTDGRTGTTTHRTRMSVGCQFDNGRTTIPFTFLRRQFDSVLSRQILLLTYELLIGGHPRSITPDTQTSSITQNSVIGVSI